jgi:hypothetical protein
MQIVDRCAPWKIANSAQNPVLQALQFRKVGICHKFPGSAGISNWRIPIMYSF